MTAVGILFLFQRFNISSILGYLVAGIFIGPHVLNIISNPQETHFLGELGVIALLFTLGLDLPFQRLKSLQKHVFGIGLPQVLLTGACFTGIAFWMGFSSGAAVLLGAALSLSSTAMVLQVLNDRRELATRFGRVSFSVLLFQDLMVVLLLILATSLGLEGSSVFEELSYAAFKTILALTLIIGLGRFVFRPFYRAISIHKNSELFMGTTFLLVLGMGYITDTLGLSMELGAFLAGILLAETEYRHQVEADIQPFRGLLLGIFFISVGMEIDIETLFNNFSTVMLFLSLVVVIKAFLVFGIARIFKLGNFTSLRVALLLAGGGEFVFVIFSPSVAEKLLSPETLSLLFLVVTLSMALTPLLAFLGKQLEDKFQIREVPGLPHLSPPEGEDVLKNHIIIAGFGRVGQMLADILDARLIHYVAVDVDMNRIAEGRAQGRPVFYGDVKNVEVLKAIGAENAKAIVITLNHVPSSVRAVTIVRRYFPDIPVCVRIKDHKHRDKLANSGAHLVVPETVEPTIQLAGSVLNLMEVPGDEIDQIITKFRRRVEE